MNSNSSTASPLKSPIHSGRAISLDPRNPLTSFNLAKRLGRASGAASSVNLSTVKLSTGMSETQVAATGAARVKVGSQTLYIGTRQVTSINQDPIVLAYEGGKLKWSNTKYETTGADGRGYGLFYNGTSLYGVFSIDGTQGTSSQDFRRASSGATQSWMRTYGAGGGAKAAVVAKLDPKTGNLQTAVYLSAVNSGKTNSFQVKGLSMSGSNLAVTGISYFAPRNVDGTAMKQTDMTKKSPFTYNITLTSDLKKGLKASASGWQSKL